MVYGKSDLWKDWFEGSVLEQLSYIIHTQMSCDESDD